MTHGVESRDIMWHCLCDPTFSHFSTIPACDRQTDTQGHSIYRASIASRGKKKENGLVTINNITKVNSFGCKATEKMQIITEHVKVIGNAQ